MLHLQEEFSTRVHKEKVVEVSQRLQEILALKDDVEETLHEKMLEKEAVEQLVEEMKLEANDLKEKVAHLEKTHQESCHIRSVAAEVNEIELKVLRKENAGMEEELYKLRTQMSSVAVLHSKHVEALQVQLQSTESARDTLAASLSLKEEEIRKSASKFRDQKRAVATQLQQASSSIDELKIQLRESESACRYTS